MHETGKPRRVFVGGPILHAFLNGNHDDPLREAIRSSFVCLEEAGCEVFSAHRVEQFGRNKEELLPDHVARRDFDWMRECHCFVAFLPDGPSGLLRTDGTHVELGWASALKKPIVIVTSLPMSNHSPLLRGLGTIAVLDTLEFSSFCDKPGLLVETVNRLCVARDGHSGDTSKETR